MATTTTDESGVWVKFQGDDWSWNFTTTATVSTWSDPRITIRESRSSTATVLATTEAVTPTITTTGTNFATGTLKWQVADTHTDDIAPGQYWLEVEVLIGTDVRTILSRPFRVLPQVAVAL
jgi:hypothetical protein